MAKYKLVWHKKHFYGDCLTKTCMRIHSLYELLKKLTKWQKEGKHLKGHLDTSAKFIEIETDDENIIEKLEKSKFAIDIWEKEYIEKWKIRSQKAGII